MPSSGWPRWARIVRLLSSRTAAHRPSGPNRLWIVRSCSGCSRKRTVQPSSDRRPVAEHHAQRRAAVLELARGGVGVVGFAGSVRELVRRVHLDHHPPERRHEVWPGQQRMVRRPAPYQEQTELARLDAHEGRTEQQPEHESQQRDGYDEKYGPGHDSATSRSARPSRAGAVRPRLVHIGLSSRSGRPCRMCWLRPATWPSAGRTRHR